MQSFSYTLYYADGGITFVDHSDKCKEIKEPLHIIKSHSTTVQNLISPDKRLAVVKDIASGKSQDRSLKLSQLHRMVPYDMQPIKKQLVQQALNENRSNVSASMSYTALTNEFKINHLPFKEVYGVDGDISAIVYHDPVIAPDNIEFIFILTSDVTHGIFDYRTGFQKLCLWCGIDAARHIKPLGKYDIK